LYNKGQHSSHSTEFKKGQTPWSKENPELCKPNSGSFKKGHPTWNKGLKGYRSGALNNNWKGGITQGVQKIRWSQDMKKWRKSVFERDNYTCQICKQRGGCLNAHHIKPFTLYPDDRLEIDNGVTLCRKHHHGVHIVVRALLNIQQNVYAN
jgi:hypothetical protein